MKKGTLYTYILIIIILIISALVQYFYGQSHLPALSMEHVSAMSGKPYSDSTMEFCDYQILEDTLQDTAIVLDSDRYISEYNSFSSMEEVQRIMEDEINKIILQKTIKENFNRFYYDGRFHIGEVRLKYIIDLCEEYDVPLPIPQKYLDEVYLEDEPYPDGSVGLGFFKLNSNNLPIYKILIKGFDVYDFHHNTQAFILHCLKLKQEGNLQLDNIVKEIGFGDY